MKANRGQIERALDAPGGDIRLYLLHGPDEAGSRALAARLERAMGSDAERIELDSAALKGDPARLADEAAAISLFGGARHIRLTLAAPDDAMAAVEALLEAPAAGNPVVAIAGTLRPASVLLKRALDSATILAFASYAPEGQDAERLAAAMARDAGLRLSEQSVARRIALSAANDRAVMAQEIEKLALYLDAAPDRPGTLDHDTLDALAADAGEGDIARLIDAAMGGDPASVATELARLAGVGIEGIPLIRAALKRAQLLIPLRAEVEAGRNPAEVIAGAGKAIFWKEKDAVQRQLASWSAARLATATGRLLAAERTIKASGSIGAIAADVELVAIGRAARRTR